MKKTVLALSLLLFTYPALAAPDPDHETDRSVTSFPVITPASDDGWILTDTSNSGRFGKVATTGVRAAIGLGTSDNPSFNSLHASGGNLAASNAQVTKKWITGLSYTSGVTSVIHGGKHYICTSDHTAGSSTEPDVGVSWETVWKPAEAIDASGFNGNLANTDDTLQEVAQKLDDLVTGGISHATSDGNYYASKDGAWASLTGVFASPLGADDNYVTDAEKTKLSNLSGTNTGDQTGASVSFADTDNLFTATSVGAALEEFNDSINTGSPNGTGAKVHWSQLLGVPAGFADGTDSEGTGGGYTNLTSFIDQTAWRLFYSDGSGDVKELALGADGEYLKSNGAALAPSWATPSGAAHDAVTLSTDLGNNLLGLSTQQLTLDSQTANYVFAAPNGSAGVPVFRAIVDADIPDTITASNYSLTSHNHTGTYEPADADLTDLADGTLTGSKVGTGISGTNITTGTVPDAQIASTIARDSEVTSAVSTHAGLADPHTGYMLESNVGTGANNYVQLNASSQLPAVSAALLTNFPTLNQNTTGTAGGLSGTPNITVGTVTASEYNSSCAGTTDCRSNIPENSGDHVPAAGAEEIYNESGQLKVSESGTEYDMMHSGDVDDTPVNGVTSAPVSSNWAYDHVAAADPHTGYVLEDADLTTWAGITPGANVGTFIATPSSANLRGAVSDESGTGALLFAGGDVGAATATTASANDNDTSVATTAYVQTELTGYASDSVSLTNKTVDVEGTGNSITIVDKVWFAAGGCNNTTATSFYDLPTSNPAAAACITGTNTQKGVLDFDAATDESGQVSLALPSDWSGNIDLKYKWLAAATSGSVVWGVQTSCVADAETDDPSWNTASTVTDAVKGTTLQTNDASMTSITVTGCAAGELMHLRFFRDADNGSDDMTGDARLIGAELTLRRAQ